MAAGCVNLGRLYTEEIEVGGIAGGGGWIGKVAALLDVGVDVPAMKQGRRRFRGRRMDVSATSPLPFLVFSPDIARKSIIQSTRKSIIQSTPLSPSATGGRTAAIAALWHSP
ncbi:hypothetical protein L2E82_12329 [Cichorium intybus]|uniref:Uncharacterized protein n=1 Tax=Cichorium intybus TaxID=13427 RepID=A0ACB9GF91_CICIN|nr:hypothetical protein L2E82_12329 [Cichorium intybus]